MATLAAGACSKAPTDPLIATFRGGRILQSDLDSWRGAGRFLPDGGKAPNRMDAVERLTILYVLSEEAVREGLEKDPLIAFALRRETREHLAGVLRRAVLEQVKLPAAEVDSYLAAHDAERRKPERRQVSYILKRVPAGESPRAARAELEAALARLRAGEDFAELAREVSDSQTRFRGGRLGIVRPGQLPTALDTALFALAQGEVSKVLTGHQGVLVIRCDQIKPAYEMPVQEARDRIEAHLRRPRAEQAWQKLVGSLTANRIAHDLKVLSDQNAPADAIVGRYGDEVLTRGEALLLASSQRGAQPDSDSALRQTLDRFGQDCLLGAEARRRGLDRGARVRRELEWRRRERLARILLDRRVQKLVPEPSAQALEAYFAGHRDDFRSRARFRLAVLWLRLVPESAEPQYRSLAKAVADIHAGKLSFRQAAHKFPHPKTTADGELGWVPRSKVAGWGPTALRTVEALEPGEVSEVVQEQAAFWVFQLLAYEPPKPRSYQEAQELVRAAFQREQRRTQVEQTLRRTLAEARLQRVAEPAWPQAKKKRADNKG